MWNKTIGLVLMGVAVFCLGIFGASLLHPHQTLEAPPSPVLRDYDELPALDRKSLPERPTASSEAIPTVPTPEVDASPVLSVPSLGLEVPLGTIVPENGEVTPPEFDRAYVVDGYSVSPENAEQGSIYVVFHSERHAHGIGNNFFNQSTGEPIIGTEEIVTVHGVDYKVLSTEAVRKDELANRSDIWKPTPGRLFLITCLQNAEGTPSTHNFIITAEKV